MNVGAVGAIGSGTAPVYAVLSPFVDGVRRTSNATAGAIASPAQTAATVPAAPPFLNPAFTEIAALASLHGDGGMLVQSYDAVALLTAPVALTSIYGVPATPAVSAVAAITASPRVPRIETAA